MNEALKCLRFLKDEVVNDIACFKDSVTTKTLYQLYFTNFDTIEQALLKTQEQEKVLDIIKEKCLFNDNFYLISTSLDYDRYVAAAELGIQNITQVKLKENDLLTQEEFESIKRYYHEKNRGE